MLHKTSLSSLRPAAIVCVEGVGQGRETKAQEAFVSVKPKQRLLLWPALCCRENQTSLGLCFNQAVQNLQGKNALGDWSTFFLPQVTFVFSCPVGYMACVAKPDVSGYFWQLCLVWKTPLTFSAPFFTHDFRNRLEQMKHGNAYS